MKQSPLTLAVYIVAGLLVVGALAFKIFQPIQVLPRIRLGPGYALIDQNGDVLSNESVRGQLVLYSFTTTRCETSTCDAITVTMQEVQEAVPSIETGGVPIRLVTISLDPAYDTPAVLSQFAQEVNADPTIWTFATNQDEALLKNIIGAGFEVYYDGPTRFDQAFILVDGAGIVRGEYRYQTLATDSERIIRHLGVLGEEIMYSHGATAAAYEAAHLFLCYAP